MKHIKKYNELNQTLSEDEKNVEDIRGELIYKVRNYCTIDYDDLLKLSNEELQKLITDAQVNKEYTLEDVRKAYRNGFDEVAPNGIATWHSYLKHIGK